MGLRIANLGEWFGNEWSKGIGIRLKRVDARQSEERGAFVRRVKGETANYDMPVCIDSVQMLFLFRKRPYVITVRASSSSSLFRDVSKEAWEWHGEILAANAGDS